MLTFTSLGGITVKCKNGSKTVVSFPDNGAQGDILLLAKPEDDPEEGRISWPGEYDYDGVSIRGIGLNEGQEIFYVMQVEEVRIAFLPTPLRELDDYIWELMGDIDVLFLPADDAKIAQKIIEQLDPRILVPLPTKDQDTFEEILKKVGAQNKDIESEIKVKSRGSLPAEGRDVVILKPQK